MLFNDLAKELVSYIYFFGFISLLADIFKYVLCLNVKFLSTPMIIFIFISDSTNHVCVKIFHDGETDSTKACGTRLFMILLRQFPRETANKVCRYIIAG